MFISQPQWEGPRIIREVLDCCHFNCRNRFFQTFLHCAKAKVGPSIPSPGLVNSGVPVLLSIYGRHGLTPHEGDSKRHPQPAEGAYLRGRGRGGERISSPLIRNNTRTVKTKSDCVWLCQHLLNLVWKYNNPRCCLALPHSFCWLLHTELLLALVTNSFCNQSFLCKLHFETKHPPNTTRCDQSY